MNPVQQLIDVQERLYTLRDELARAPTEHKGVARTQMHAAADLRLARIESGLYPVCQSCGERIEIERLREDALADYCAHCASRPAVSQA